MIVTKKKYNLLLEENKKLKEELLEYEKAIQEGQKAIDLALNYEEFYNSTLEEIGETLNALEEIINKRQLLFDDPDIQNLVKLISIVHDILLRYINAKATNEKESEKQNTEDKV